MKLVFENYGNDINLNKEVVWLGDKFIFIIGVVCNFIFFVLVWIVEI